MIRRSGTGKSGDQEIRNKIKILSRITGFSDTQVPDSRMCGYLNYRRAQTTLELTIALVLIMILLVGSAKIFVWLNGRMVQRAEDYEGSRIAAGSVPAGAVDLSPELEWQENMDPGELDFENQKLVDESAYAPLNVFKKQE